MEGKAIKSQGMIKRKFESREPVLWKDVCVTLLRSHLGIAMQMRNPHLQGEIENIESVQRRTTRIPNDF